MPDAYEITYGTEEEPWRKSYKELLGRYTSVYIELNKVRMKVDELEHEVKNLKACAEIYKRDL